MPIFGAVAFAKIGCDTDPLRQVAMAEQRGYREIGYGDLAAGGSIANGAATSDVVARRSGMGLALSGGGFRATLFAIGSLWRLNELGWLPRLTRITSVSGGSIASAYLAIRWRELTFDSNGVATNFKTVTVDPLRQFCAQTMDWKVILRGLLLPLSSVAEVARHWYETRLFCLPDGAPARLSDLPTAGAGPEFLIYATGLQTGSSVRFTRDGVYDWKLGTIRRLDISVGAAVAASAAFPPFLSPLRLRTDPTLWRPSTRPGRLAQPNGIRGHLHLTDGGVYDNMGLEALWHSMQTVLVSDAGAPFEFRVSPWGNWISQLDRVRDILIDQTRALRKRVLVGELSAGAYAGAYWGIGTRIANFELPDSLCADSESTASLALVKTRLKALPEPLQCRLINWAYALTDTAIRRHVDPRVSKGSWPYPTFGL
jgi:NTE family protein